MKKLCIYDFDDTLVTTDDRIDIVRLNGTRESLSSKQFGKYILQPGETCDFTSFRSDLINPKPRMKYVNMLKRTIKLKDTENIILTARSVLEPIQKYMLTLGIDVPIITLACTCSTDKTNWIINKISETSDLKYILYIDDADKNIDEVEKIVKLYPNIKFVIHHVL